MLQAGIEIWLTLCQSDVLSLGLKYFQNMRKGKEVISIWSAEIIFNGKINNTLLILNTINKKNVDLFLGGGEEAMTMNSLKIFTSIDKSTSIFFIK